MKQSSSVPEFKLGTQIVKLSRTTLSFGGQELKVHIAECRTDEDAAKVHELFLAAHTGVHEQCPRDGKTVVEFVFKDPRLLERAYTELGFKPPKASYTVAFRAAPIEACDYAKWNPLCGACFAPKPDEARIRELAKGFTFGNTIRLRTHGLGGDKASFAFDPKPTGTGVEEEGDT